MKTSAKSLMTMVVAGLIGGTVTLGGAYLLFGKPRDARVENVSPRSSFTAANMPFSFADAAGRATPAVVHISAKQTKRQQPQQRPRDPFEQFFGMQFQQPLKQGTGSGVIISEDGYIVTNNHVVDFADEVEVTLNDKRKFLAKIIGTDPSTDLAVLKVEGSNLPAIQKSDSDKARIGEWVLAIGNPAVGYDERGQPLELNSSVTAGIISARGRNIGVGHNSGNIESFIQTDAVVNPGNSGGALVDAEGRLIGINTAIATTNGRYQGYSFAIPVNLMSKVVDDIIEYGQYRRVFLGVEAGEVDADVAKELDLKVTNGVYIDKIVDGGSAQSAGLRPRDVITNINGRGINTFAELQEIVGSARVGDTLMVTVSRNGSTIKVPVVLKAG